MDFNTINREEELELIRTFYAEALVIVGNKAHDYANDDDCFSNFKKIAKVVEVPIEKVFLTFMMVKIARLVELVSKTNIVSESIRDTLIDLANYAGLMAVYLDTTKQNKVS